MISSFKLVNAVAIINIITAAIQIGFMTFSYLNIKNYKQEYIKTITNQFNYSIKLSIKETNEKIKFLNNSVYMKKIFKY